MNPLGSGLSSFTCVSRLSCYKCITDTMQELVNQSKAAPQSPSVPKQPGPPVMTSDPNMLSNEDASAHVSLHAFVLQTCSLCTWCLMRIISCLQFEQMLDLAQRSQDELFHIALYNWLIQADLTDKLLEVQQRYQSCTCLWWLAVYLKETFWIFPLLQVNSPYLEDHLMHMIKQDQSKVRNLDLLWRYYEKNRSFGKAAHVLARLAEMHRYVTSRARIICP